MANFLTGDFEAVLEISVETINRLLASLHQNGFTRRTLPSFPHSVVQRIGDTHALDGVRGSTHAQIGTPTIELIEGSTDRFWLNVDVRAWFRPDPGTEHLPAFINGQIRARYRIQDIDPRCAGWRGQADGFLWIRVDPDTVTFRGTTAEDQSSSAVLVHVPAAPVDYIPKVTHQIAYQLATTFEATPHPVSTRFRRGRMRSLRPSVILPLALSGGDPVGDINSVNNPLNGSNDFAIRVDVDYIMSFARKAMADVRDRVATMPHIPVTVHGLFGFSTVYRVYANNDFTATWEDHGQFATIKITGSGGATTDSILPNVTFSVVQYLIVNFDAGTESVTLSVGSRTVSASQHVSDQVSNQVGNVVTAACADAAPKLAAMTARKQEMVDQLRTLDDQADASIDEADFIAAGIILRGTITLARRAWPVAAFDTLGGDRFSALLSWIPGGHIDSFDWSWSWPADNQPAGTVHHEDRFLLSRPGGHIGRWGQSIDVEERLPGLDGMGQMCLTIRGRQVDPVTGGSNPVQVSSCRRYGVKLSTYVNGRALLRHIPELSRDVGFPQLSVVDAAAMPGAAPNTLVLFTDDRWDPESINVLKDALQACRREDAGLALLVLFRENSGATSQLGTAMEQVHGLAVGLGLSAMVNEDVRGTWSKALTLPVGRGQQAWRLLSPGGGVTWMGDNRVDAKVLTAALDACLIPSSPARPVAVDTAVSVGVRVPAGALAVTAPSDAPWQSNCPRPGLHLGRATPAGTKVVLVQPHSEASEAVLNDISRTAGEALDGPLVLVVVDGAEGHEADSMRDYLGLPFETIADPTGIISDRFGVGIWPTLITIGPDCRVRAIDHRSPEEAVPADAEVAGQ
jgi:hypothetical protein